MILPNFLGIGTQRAATTWLYNCLREHPDVYVPETKELLFFSKNYAKGLDYYCSYFENVSTQHAIGEISPEYIYTDNCYKLIAESIPNVKLIVILRNPISRAVSAYNIFGKDDGWSFEEAIEKKPGILSAGLYYEQLIKYFSVFDRSQFLILLYEHLQVDNKKAISKVYDFLNVDSQFIPSWIDKTVNTVPFPIVLNLLRKARADFLVDFIKKTPVAPLLRSYLKNNKENKVIDLSPKLYDYLINYYQEPNRKLEELLAVDLSLWTKK